MKKILSKKKTLSTGHHSPFWLVWVSRMAVFTAIQFLCMFIGQKIWGSNPTEYYVVFCGYLGLVCGMIVELNTGTSPYEARKRSRKVGILILIALAVIPQIIWQEPAGWLYVMDFILSLICGNNFIRSCGE